MITGSYGQRNLFETDEHLLEAVAVQMAKRRPHSRTHGRPGTPVEVALRTLVLKRLRGWSFEETEREVRASLLYRKLVRVYFGKVPDAKTLVRLSAVIGSEGVEAIHDRLLEIARAQKLIAGRRARVDTTVVETDIRYPTDSRLLADGVRVLRRALKRIEEATGVVGAQLRDRMRATTHRVLEIARAARSRGRARDSGWNAGIAGSWQQCAARCAIPSGSVRSFSPELERCSASAGS